MSARSETVGVRVSAAHIVSHIYSIVLLLDNFLLLHAQQHYCNAQSALFVWLGTRTLFTHADGSRGSKAIAASVILSDCPHDKTKTAESTITKLGTGIVHHDTSPTNEY